MVAGPRISLNIDMLASAAISDDSQPWSSLSADAVSDDSFYRVSQKNDPLRFFANISAKGRNYQTKYYRLIGNSFLHINDKFHQKMLKETKVMSLLVSPPL